MLPGSEDIFYLFHMTLDGYKEFFVYQENHVIIVRTAQENLYEFRKRD